MNSVVLEPVVNLVISVLARMSVSTFDCDGLIEVQSPDNLLFNTFPLFNF